jgi:DNA-binding transcriptional MerR regulator
VNSREEVITARTAAKMYGVSRVELHEWADLGLLVPVSAPEDGSDLRFRVSDLDDFFGLYSIRWQDDIPAIFSS